MFWLAVATAVAFSLACFSDAFLILRAREAGLPIALAPAVLVVMNVVYAAAAYPAGALSDRFGRLAVLGAGFAVLIAADLTLALASGLAGVAAGISLWGLQMGVTKGALAALVADAAPSDARGSAYGILEFRQRAGVARSERSVWRAVGSQRTSRGILRQRPVRSSCDCEPAVVAARIDWTRRKTVDPRAFADLASC